jgi:hypothetical protein
MNCNTQVQKNYDAPATAGAFRFLLGLAIFFVGLYVTILPGVQEYGLGFLATFGSLFVMFKDE